MIPRSMRTTMMPDFQETMLDLDARARLLVDAREHFANFRNLHRSRTQEQHAELTKTLDCVLHILNLVQRSDESIMLIRRECHVIIEQCSRAMNLVAERPAAVFCMGGHAGGVGGNASGSTYASAWRCPDCGATATSVDRCVTCAGRR